MTGAFTRRGKAQRHREGRQLCADCAAGDGLGLLVPNGGKPEAIGNWKMQRQVRPRGFGGSLALPMSSLLTSRLHSGTLLSF